MHLTLNTDIVNNQKKNIFRIKLFEAVEFLFTVLNIKGKYANNT